MLQERKEEGRAKRNKNKEAVSQLHLLVFICYGVFFCGVMMFSI